MAVNGPDQSMFDNTSMMLSKLMEMSMERQRVISSNIANVNTPGYKRRVLSFESEFARLVKEQDQASLEKMRGFVEEDTKSPGREDGNNVQLPNETNDLMQNGMYHRLLNRALKLKMSILKAAITK